MGSLAVLPRDIWQLIAEKIIDHKDILRFGVVCKQWRSIVMDNLHLLPPKLPLSLCLPSSSKTPRLPLLMQCRNEDELGTIEFFSVTNNRNYSGFVVPEINKKWLAGSSHGWLFTIDIPGREINLLNPLTRTQIPLPSLSAFQHPDGGFTDAETDDFGFVAKAVISSDPSRRRNLDDENCIVVAIISQFQVLSFCRPGDGKWTNVEGSPTCLTDVILYNGHFYAVNELGIVVVFDVVAQEKKVKQIANSVGMWITKRYLVKSMSGELLQVVRIMDEENGPRTVKFCVYMLEAVDEPVEEEGVRYFTIDNECPNKSKFNFDWVELESLGDQVLFVGLNYSLAVPAVQIPGCKGNCIYFTSHHMIHVCFVRGDADEDEAPCDMGIYDLADGRVRRPFDEVDVKFLIPPIWVSPSL